MVIYAGLLESICMHKPCPFLTINCELALMLFSSDLRPHYYIMHSSNALNAVTALHFVPFSKNQFQSDVPHNIKEKICCYFHYVANLRLELAAVVVALCSELQNSKSSAFRCKPPTKVDIKYHTCLLSFS